MNGLKRSALDFDESHPNNKRKVESSSSSIIVDSSSKMESEAHTDSSMTDVISSTSTPELSTTDIVNRLNTWTQVLSSSPSTFNNKGKGKETIESLNNELLLVEEAAEGSITLTSTQAKDLISTLQSTVQAFLSTPITRSDLLALLTKVVVSGSSTPTFDSPSPRKTSAFDRLPEDIIVMVAKAIREIHRTGPEDGGITRYHSRSRAGWIEVKKLSMLNKSWRSALRPLFAAECHIADTRMLPTLAKSLRGDSVRAQGLTSLFIKVYDFEFSFSKSSADAGFSLPDCIRLSPNLLNIAIQTDRNTAAASFRRTLRESHDMNTFTGGVSLPDTIISSCKSLRTLIFGVSCTVDDISNFTSQLKYLRSLTVTGDIDSTAYTIPFSTCGPQLKKLWLPTTSLGPITLANLVLNSSVISLAATIDLDDYFNPSPPTAESIALTKTKLIKLFERIGGKLIELSISTPFADQIDNNRLRLPIGANGGLGGGIGGGAAGGGGGPGGLAGFGNNIAMQITQIVGGVLGNQMGGAGGAGGGGNAGARQGPAQVNGVQAGGNNGPLPPPLNGGVPLPGPRTRRAPAAGANPQPLPPINIGGGGAGGGGGGGNFIGGAFNIPGIHLFGFNPINAPPPTPFFEELIQSCPNLISLELYGRRYSTSLLPSLRERDQLEFLALSLPLDGDRVLSGFEEALKDSLKEGLKGLKRMELSGKGGEWLATERRGIKEICERRGIAYSSSN